MDLGRSLVGHILDAAIPPSCVGCSEEGTVLCERCVPALAARRDAPAGWPIGMPADLPAPLVQLEWCAAYTGVVRDALHALKYRGERRLARPLGEALALRWRSSGAGGDVLVPVPVHPGREAERGYDQAVLLASAASSALRMPTAPLLHRRRATARQFDLDRTRRRANVTGAFELVGGASSIVSGRWIVLVDDVVTTGSTLAACAEALMVGGALAVSAVTVARER